jgi:hypothetical protein
MSILKGRDTLFGGRPSYAYTIAYAHNFAQLRIHSTDNSTGNGLVVPSSSHKRKVAGSIPAGSTKTFLFPLPLLPHQLMSCFEVGRLLSYHEKSAQDIAATTDTTARPAHVEKKKVLPLQSTGEERKEENSTVQLVICQYWYKL